MEYTDVLRLIDTGSSVAVLVVLLVLFLRGDVVSKSTVEAIVQQSVDAFYERLEQRARRRSDTQN